MVHSHDALCFLDVFIRLPGLHGFTSSPERRRDQYTKKGYKFERLTLVRRGHQRRPRLVASVFQVISFDERKILHAGAHHSDVAHSTAMGEYGPNIKGGTNVKEVGRRSTDSSRNHGVEPVGKVNASDSVKVKAELTEQ